MLLALARALDVGAARLFAADWASAFDGAAIEAPTKRRPTASREKPTAMHLRGKVIACYAIIFLSLFLCPTKTLRAIPETILNFVGLCNFPAVLLPYLVRKLLGSM